VDFGAVDELPYMVMELLSGESLAERMQRDPPLRMEEVVHFASLTLRGLAAVHEAGIVHRDLKPQNIFLHRDTDTVYPKILDFGISRSLGGDEERPSAISTQDGMIVGTPDYMSPEQARGEKNIDKRADIYSMGAIIYEGITGRLPYEANTIGELIVKIVTTTPAKMVEVRPDVPQLLSDCIAQAMAHDREERFIDAQVFRRALLSAAEKSFSTDARSAASDRPVRLAAPPAPPAPPVPLVPLVPPPPAAGASLPFAVPPPATAPLPELGFGNPPAANAAWGDFEGLSQPSGRISPPLQLAVPLPSAATEPAPLAAGASSASREPSLPRPLAARAADPIAAAGLPAGRPSAPGKKAARNGGGRSLPKGAHVAPEDPSLLGNSPFDSLGGGGGALDLDYGLSQPGPRPRASQKSIGAKTPVQARIGAGAQRAAPAQRPAPVRGVVARRRLSLLWIAPALLLVGLVVLLLSPALFSSPAPDTAGAAELEAHGPATAGSDRRMQLFRRKAVGSRPPALRDVGF
jgi:hypothetical protein